VRHYTCDGCGADLSQTTQDRFVVKIESQASRDLGELTEADLDQNVIEETAALLRALEDGLAANEELTSLPNRAAMEYDLCPHCFGEYLKDPIGRTRRQSLAFSNN
jgi:hypothetical protein